MTKQARKEQRKEGKKDVETERKER